MDLGKVLVSVLLLAALASGFGIIYTDMTTRYGVAGNSTQFSTLNDTIERVEPLTESLEANLRAVQLNPASLIIVAPALVINVVLVLVNVLIWLPLLVIEVAGMLGVPPVITGALMLIPVVLVIVALIRFVVGRQEGQGI